MGYNHSMLGGKYEPLDMMVLATAVQVPTYVYDHVLFDGRLDVDRLIDAVAKVATVVPETLYRLDARRMKFKDMGFTARDVVTEIQQRVDTGFVWDLTRGTQVKILVGHGPDSDSMIVAMDHVLGDGMSMVQYMTLLAAAYNGEWTDIRNNRSSSMIVAASDFGPATPSEVRSFQLPIMSLPLPDTGKDLFARHITLPASTMDALHEKAHSCSATLDDLFVTACARVACRMMDVPALAVRCPVDLRHYADPGPLSIANMTGLYRMTVDVAPGDRFGTTLEQVHQEKAIQRERHRFFFNIPNLAKMARRLPTSWVKSGLRKIYSSQPIALSNFGIIPSLGFGDANMTLSYTAGAYRAHPDFDLSVSSFAGTTTFVTTLIGDEKRADACEDVIRAIISELENWLAGQN